MRLCKAIEVSRRITPGFGLLKASGEYEDRTSYFMGTGRLNESLAYRELQAYQPGE